MAKKKDDSKRIIRAIRRKRIKPPREFEDGTVGRTKAWTDWAKTKKRDRPIPAIKRKSQPRRSTPR